MNAEKFWQLIGLIDQDHLRTSDDDQAVAPLIAALAGEPPVQIRSFEDHLARALHALDGEAFAALAGPNGESSDAFLYCRCFAVALGHEAYLSVLTGKCPPPQSIDEWCEALLFTPAKAWAQRTGADPDRWDHEPVVSYETGSNEALWPQTEPQGERDPFEEPVFERAIARAGHQFRAGNLDNVVKLLAPHEKRLSGKLLSMLRSARASAQEQA